MSVIIFLVILSIILCALLLMLFLSNGKLRDMIGTLKADVASRDASIESLRATYAISVNKEKELSSELAAMNHDTAELKVINGRLEERIRINEAEYKRIKEETDARFSNMAQQVLEEKSKLFKEANETRLGEILAPFKENIEQFKKTITDNYISEAKERHSLQDHIKQLMELNQSIGKEAKDLTNALKGSTKMQGDWGEMILEELLEKSGLERDRQYFVQMSRDDDGLVIKNDEGGLLRPDVVILLPENKKMIVDSKVSLKSYVNFVNAEEKEEQEKNIALHITSVRNHINELKTKKYQDFIKDASDFVMMFIPNEGAYITAMQHDPTLWQYAYDNRVVIVSPTHLISALKLVNDLWRHDKQTKNAINIAEESGKLYDKFFGFIQDMSAIEKNLKGTQKSFDDAMSKLYTGRGNLIRQVEKLKTLGAKASKALPESDEE